MVYWESPIRYLDNHSGLGVNCGNFLDLLAQETNGESLSRVILNEKGISIGVTSLVHINHYKKRCHLGTWFGKEHWGQGYNEESKLAILHIAFVEMGMNYVFAGARFSNVRSQKAQEKLPYMKLNVETLFPEEHAYLEEVQGAHCVLHAVFSGKISSSIWNRTSSDCVLLIRWSYGSVIQRVL